MKQIPTSTRRSFIKQSALSATGLLLSPNVFSAPAAPNIQAKTNYLQVNIFSKHLQFLNYRNMSEAAKEMGFDGVDLTVRPKGHVLPENVTRDLPLATEIMKSYDLLTKMLSTNVLDIKNPVHIKILETASQLGYQYYRPDWIRYNFEEDVQKTLDLARRRFNDLSEINKRFGISTSYHNHSGYFFGSAIWDLHHVLENLSPDQMGSQYDIMHAIVEGGKNWEISFNLIKPYINTIVVKDFVWRKKADRWTIFYTPLGEGMVDFNKYFSLLKKNNINVPMSLHVEYDLGGAEHGAKPTITQKEVFSRIKKDLEFIRHTWATVSH